MLSTFAGYQIEAKIYESARSVVYRGRLDTASPAVILKLLQPSFATPENISRFRREYEITRSLDGQGCVQVIDLVEDGNQLAIVLEDFGGQSLPNCTANQPLDVATFLGLAIQICQALAHVHQQNIIHKDINPANIVWNRQTNLVKIIDFGLATTLPNENPEIRSPNVLEGTLPYISPEQTGRMNRAMDYRSDFYSLGVTFYELLSQFLPFTAVDPLELVHAHLARTPTALHNLNPAVPQQLSDIVMRLLAKNAEDRYQSAYGLKVDLEQCLHEWQSSRTISFFPLAQKDVHGRFQLPQKLYGRDDELHTLLQAFYRVTTTDYSRAELLLVAGPPGIGKSALVQELYKPITARRGYFAAGKFDQLHNAPYTALITAFDALLGQLLTEGEAELSRWQQQLQEALHPNAQLLTDVLPTLKLIIGPTTAVADLPPAEAENRFHLTFQQFIRVLAQPEHPLLLFLDDWQWMDGASRQLLQNLFTSGSAHHLLLVGAYRDTEMPPAHPSRITIDHIAATGTAVSTITLAPLTSDQLNQFVADTLQASPDRTADLARLLQAKTNGNPFFLGEFMKSLYRAELLSIDYNHGRWQWDLAQIEAADITDNVVQLMMANIQEMALKTQMALTLAACIGSRFDLHTLALFQGESVTDTAVALWPAIVKGLILPLNDQYKLAQFNTAVNPLYKFAHDRIQQAAYTLIPEQNRQQIHWQMGQHLLQQPDAPIFDVLNHLNLGYTPQNDQQPPLPLAQLNLQAAQAAREASAFMAALEYALIGLNLLAKLPTPWQTHYDLMLGLSNTAVEAAAQSAQFDQMAQISQEALPHIHTLLDKMPIYRTLMRAYHVQNRMADTIALARPLLQQLGIELPTQPTRAHLLTALVETQWRLRGKTVDDMLQLPHMSDPEKIAATEIMTRVGTAAYFVSPLLFALVVMRLIRIFLHYGNHPEAARTYTAYGLILTGFLQNVKRGNEFGELGLKLIEQFNAREFYPGTVQLVGHYLSHWHTHLRDAQEEVLNGYQIALETGNLEFASNCSFSYNANRFFVGDPLEELIPEMSEHMAMMQHFNQHKLKLVLAAFLQMAVNLNGQGERPWELEGEHFKAAESVAIYQQLQDQPSLYTYLIQKGMLLYWFGHYAEANTAFIQAIPLRGSVAAAYINTCHTLYQALSQIGLYPNMTAVEQKQVRKQLRLARKQFRKWTSLAPMNYQHKEALLAAEEARILQQSAIARPLYEQAIQLAHQHGYIQEEALAYELAGRFFDERGYGSLAQHYLTNARQAYNLWGATAKTADLEARFPHYLVASTHPNNKRSHSLTSSTTSISSTSLSSTAVLDLNSVIKASQALSSHIKLTDLLNQLMAVVIENAGAQAGYLLLPKQNEWHVAARGGTANPETDTQLPASLLNFVTRTRESVVLDNAAQVGAFVQDPMIQKRQARSVLCLPLLHHGNLTGILYLENNLAPGAFTPERLTVLNLLASQAAISLENAQLLTQLQEHGRTLEQQVEQRTADLAQANLEAQAARAAAEEANENKSLFLSNMSRELRTPLSVIIGFTHLVRQNGQHTLAEKQLDNLDKVLVSADHLLSLINTVIDIAKIESGHMDVQPTEFDPIELVESCLATTQPLLKKHVSLQPQFTHPLPTIYSDAAKIKQIIINLLSNAAKFTHQGEILVAMFCRDDQLSIAVSDTGIGISHEALSRVFEEFIQAESTTRQQYGGTGLGLPISRSLARLLGGELNASSILGQGSTFTLTIPTRFSAVSD